MTMPAEAFSKARNALATIVQVLEAAGFAMGAVVRVRAMITEALLRHEIAPALREASGRCGRRRR